MQRVTYYSNVTDEKLGMTNSGGVPNTKQGHCGKMEKIIRFVKKFTFCVVTITTKLSTCFY